jgi:rhodanese-related sulfurtransferase
MSALFSFLASHPILTAALVGVVLAWISWEISQLRRGFVALSPQQLVLWMNKQNARVIDLATNNEFLKLHVDGAVNMPAADFALEHKALKGEKNRPIVLCDRGNPIAATIAAKLKAAGFPTVAILDGGLEAWQAAQLPCARGR